MNTGKSLIAFVLFYILALFTVPAAGQQNVKATELDSIIISNMDQAGMVGVGAAVIVNKQVVWMKGYGYADQKKKIPFTPNTIMNIASIVFPLARFFASLLTSLISAYVFFGVFVMS